jgi:hypothetical protein
LLREFDVMSINDVKIWGKIGCKRSNIIVNGEMKE